MFDFKHFFCIKQSLPEWIFVFVQSYVHMIGIKSSCSLTDTDQVGTFDPLSTRCEWQLQKQSNDYYTEWIKLQQNFQIFKQTKAATSNTSFILLLISYIKEDATATVARRRRWVWRLCAKKLHEMILKNYFKDIKLLCPPANLQC